MVFNLVFLKQSYGLEKKKHLNHKKSLCFLGRLHISPMVSAGIHCCHHPHSEPLQALIYLGLLF